MSSQRMQGIAACCLVVLTLAYGVSVWHRVTQPVGRFTLSQMGGFPVRLDMQTGRVWLLFRPDTPVDRRMVFHELHDREAQSAFEETDKLLRDLLKEAPRK